MEPLYDIYLYDPDTGDRVGWSRNVKESRYKALANELHYTVEMCVVKVFAHSDGRLVYTLGV